MSQPLVSFGIPTYNGAPKIEKTIQSILDQDYASMEIIVSDNCSTDRTQEIIERLQKTEPRISYIRHPENRGVYPNFKAARDQAQGKYFMWVSDDDFLEKGIVPKYVDFLESHPNYVSVIGQILYWRNGKVADSEQGINLTQGHGLARVFSYYSRVVHGAMWYALHRREAVKDIPVESALAGDWHFLAAAAFRGKIKQLDQPGYHKDYETGSSSSGFRRVLRLIGQPEYWAKAPFVKIGLEAMRATSGHFPVYRTVSPWIRYPFAFLTGMTIILKYYLVVVPKILGGKILRTLKIPTPSQIRQKLSEERSG